MPRFLITTCGNGEFSKQNELYLDTETVTRRCSIALACNFTKRGIVGDFLRILQFFQDGFTIEHL